MAGRKKMKHFGLFEGIGGFSLAANWMGWDTVAWCEINKECQRVLNLRFPKAEGFGDIKTTDFKKYANAINIITGGFPCPEFSFAGKGRMGMELWKEMFRACREIRPDFIVAENVPGFAFRKGGMALDEVCNDLESENYEVIPLIIPAASAGAFHKRDRVWIIAIKKYALNSDSNRLRSHRKKKYEQGGFEFRYEQICLPGSLVSQSVRNGTDPRVFRDTNGISSRVDRIRSTGNAISPQVAFGIFKTIQQLKNKKE